MNVTVTQTLVSKQVPFSYNHRSNKCLLIKAGCSQVEQVTCLLDGGQLFGDSSRFALPYFVLRKDPEIVGVSHDEVCDGNGESVVVLQNSEPFLQRKNESQTFII